MDRCSETDELVTHLHSIITKLTLLITFLLWFPFAMHFLNKLWKISEHNSLVYTTIGYIACITIYMLSKMWVVWIDPIVQAHLGFSEVWCKMEECFVKVPSMIAYILLIQVYVCRISISFDGSLYAIKPLTLKLCHFANVSTGLFLFLALMIQATKIDCFERTKSGFLYYMGASKNTYRTCQISVTGIGRAGYFVYSTMVFVMNVVLAWMFTSRLRQILKDFTDIGLDPEYTGNDDFRLLIQKSSVTGAISMLTLLLALTLNASFQFSAIMAVDLCFNTVLLYCIFSFGEELYHKLFGQWIDSWLGCTRRKSDDNKKPTKDDKSSPASRHPTISFVSSNTAQGNKN